MLKLIIYFLINIFATMQQLNLDEIYIPIIFMNIVIGMQVSIYFFYQFYKYRHEKLNLNRIHLAYGLSLGIALVGIIFRNINNIFLKNSDLSNLFIKLSYLFFSLSLICFLIILSSKSFKDIIDIRINFLIGLNVVISIFMIIYFKIDSTEFLLIMITLLIGFLYMFIVQIILMSNSPRNVKKRLLLILIGEIILSGSILIGSNYLRSNFLKEFDQITILIFSMISFTALIFIFFGIYKFPIFLEYRWKDNLIGVYILDREQLKIIYRFDFNKKTTSEEINEMNIEKKNTFFSRGVFGIEDIFTAITKTEKKRINKIKQGDYIFLFEDGVNSLSFLSYCIVINKEMNTFNYFLKVIKSEFESLYKSILKNINYINGKEELVFSNFDTIIYNLLK